MCARVYACLHVGVMFFELVFFRFCAYVSLFVCVYLFLCLRGVPLFACFVFRQVRPIAAGPPGSTVRWA